MKSRIFTASILLLSSSTLALAASQEEADGIKSAWQAYLGTTPGLVEVKIDGDDYLVTLDAAPLIAKNPEIGTAFKVDPYVLRVRPKGNNQWDVSQTGPYNASFAEPGGNTVDVKIADLNWASVYDSVSVAFLTSTYAMKGITINQTIVDPALNMKTSSVSTIGNYSGSGSSVANTSGGVDMEGSTSVSDMILSAKSELPPDAVAAGMPNMDYNVAITGGTGKGSYKNFRAKPMLDLLAWFVANPSKELIVSKQAELKQKLEAALPLWDNVNANFTYDNVSVGTAMGQFGVASLGGGVNMNGAVKQGLFGEMISLKGLTMPVGIAPPWTDGLIPGDFNIDFEVDGFDAEAPAKLAIQQADFSKDPPISEDQGLLFLPAFAPSNTLGLLVKDGLIAAPTYKVTYDGKMTINLAGFPTGTFNIRMTGMEDVIAKVQAAAAADPNAQNTMGALVAAKGFGKAEADGSLLWVVEVTADSKILINGVDVSAMAGLAPPPQ